MPIVGNPTDAEDVAQLVLVAMWQEYHGFNGDQRQLMALCKTVATNKAIDFIRRRDRHPEMITVEVDDSSDAVLGDSAITFDDPEGIVAAERQKGAIQTALGRLPTDQFTAWYMHADGRSYKEIAARLATTEGNSRQLVARAKGFLLSETREH